MNSQTAPIRQQQAAGQQLEHELALVRDELSESVNALGSPLRELVLGRIEAAVPAYRAALVLAAGFSSEPDQITHRVHLAAALEMLYVALGIHHLLLDPVRTAGGDTDADVDRPFIGSTILAGDFCFSRAAQLAASTEDPTIVAIFAQGLQDVSEIRLRGLLSEKNSGTADGLPTTGQILMVVGADAALRLSDLSAPDQAALRGLAEAISAHPPDFAPPAATWDELPAMLPVEHSLRWQALRDWLLSCG